MNKKLVISLVLAIAMSNTFSVVSYATPNMNLNMNNLNNEEKIQFLDNEISTSMVKIENLEKNIKETEVKLEEKQKELVDVQKDYQSEKNLLKYKGGNIRSSSTTSNQSKDLNLLELLLKSENLSELFRKIHMSQQIMKQNNKTLQILELKGNQISEMQENLSVEQENLIKDKDNLLKEKETLEEKKKEVKEEIANTPAPIILDDRSVPIIDYTIPSASSEKVQALLTEAFKHLGVPYVWGGTTVNGFDCSGFTQYVYRTVGVEIPRVSQSQQFFGKQIPISEIQPGDMIFWGTPAHHVAIYIGNGQYIHAPRTGDVIKISNISGNITSATRVL